MRKLLIWSWTLVLAGLIPAAGVCAAAEDAGADRSVGGGSGDREITQQAAEKRIRGKVFVPAYHGGANGPAACDAYQVYLLPDMLPGSPGELVLDSRQAEFDFTLSAQQLKEYACLEFVSAQGNKTIKLEELKDEAVEVVLNREMFVKKPAIYLYPVQEARIEITHHFQGKLLTTYPVYTDNWTVIAAPNGDLFNIRDQRTYAYLFWDGMCVFAPEHYRYTSGFYVKKENYLSFLATKLAGIGLNEREINDFIVYWLPVMNSYENCFVHFRINDDIDGSSVLETKPQADTRIRVFMEFTGIADLNTIHNKLPEQSLPAFRRTGFVLVEWGGAEIGSAKIT